MIVSGAGLIFKGSGFYSTDYRSENYKEGAKKEAPAAAPVADSKASTGKTESKPAPAATESKPAKPTTSKA
jgi:hypothetical protein